MNDLSAVSLSNLRQGAAYMLVGLVWAMVVPATPFPRPPSVTKSICQGVAQHN
jgi:hypothetical protein